MDELKSCLLSCNPEQLNERILNLGVGIAGMGEKDTIRVDKAFLVSVLGYMEELLGMRREEENRRIASENKVLTNADRIRSMSDEELTRFIQSDLPIFRTFGEQLNWLKQLAKEDN